MHDLTKCGLRIVLSVHGRVRNILTSLLLWDSQTDHDARVIHSLGQQDQEKLNRIIAHSETRDISTDFTLY